MMLWISIIAVDGQDSREDSDQNHEEEMSDEEAAIYRCIICFE